MVNYNSSQIGIKYIRANNITIQYPENGVPTVTVSQENAVKLADNTIVAISPAESISFQLDLVGNGTTPIPLVDPTTGANLGANTTLQQLMLGMLAVIRQQQLIQNT
jgi:hypothetical protein